HVVRSPVPPTTLTSTLSLHDALPIYTGRSGSPAPRTARAIAPGPRGTRRATAGAPRTPPPGRAAAPALRPAPRRSGGPARPAHGDRKSTRLNSSHVSISYAVFCLKKK